MKATEARREVAYTGRVKGRGHRHEEGDPKKVADTRSVVERTHSHEEGRREDTRDAWSPAGERPRSGQSRGGRGERSQWMLSARYSLQGPPELVAEPDTDELDDDTDGTEAQRTVITHDDGTVITAQAGAE